MTMFSRIFSVIFLTVENLIDKTEQIFYIEDEKPWQIFFF